MITARPHGLDPVRGGVPTEIAKIRQVEFVDQARCDVPSYAAKADPSMVAIDDQLYAVAFASDMLNAAFPLATVSTLGDGSRTRGETRASRRSSVLKLSVSSIPTSGTNAHRWSLTRCRTNWPRETSSVSRKLSQGGPSSRSVSPAHATNAESRFFLGRRRRIQCRPVCMRR